MNEKIIQITDFTSGGGLGIKTCSPNANPQRVVLTHKQFTDYIGTLVDVTSKKGKTINQQTKMAKVMEFVINDACRRSNGGGVAVGINQLDLRSKTLTDGSTINQNTLSNVLKNIRHYELLKMVTTYTRYQNSNMFILGDILVELLDPITLKRQLKNRCMKKTAEKYGNRGFKIDDEKICPCCRTKKYVTKFGIDDESNLLLPVCGECGIKRNVTKVKPDGWDSAWHSFNLEKKGGINTAVTVKDIENAIDRNIDKLIDQEERKIV